MVDSATYDAWRVSPPCEHEPYTCNHECPYYHCDCWGDDVNEDVGWLPPCLQEPYTCNPECPNYHHGCTGDLASENEK